MSLGGDGVDQALCDAIAAVIARGVVVTVAAGNEAQNLLNTSPAGCGGAIAVTNMANFQAAPSGSATPADTSNWLPASASAEDKRRTLAAPGTNILSSIPGGAFDSYTGTSMASPHAAGAAARCFAAGACARADSAGAANRERVLAAAYGKWAADAAYRWTLRSDYSSASGRYYGPMVWAGAW